MGAIAVTTVSALLVAVTTTLVQSADAPLPPVSAPSPARVWLPPGARVRLSCKSPVGDASLSWRHSADGRWRPGELWGDPLPPGVRVMDVHVSSRVTSSKLVIASLDAGLAGFYRCLLRTGGGAALSAPARVSAVPSNSSAGLSDPISVSVTTGSSLVLGCLGAGGNDGGDGGDDPDPDSVSAWTRPGGSAPGRATVARDRIRIGDVRRSDAGRYACRSPGAAAGDEVVYIVSVTEPPLPPSPLRELSTAPGAMAVLTCGGGHDLPPPLWLRDGRPLTHDPRLEVGRGGSLTITSVLGGGDAGLYQCLVERGGAEAGGVTRVIVLTASRHLSSPPVSRAAGGRDPASVATATASPSSGATPPTPVAEVAAAATANQSAAAAAAGAGPKAQGTPPEAPIILSPTRTQQPNSYLLQWNPGLSSSSVLDFLIRYRELSENGSVGGRWLTVRVPPDQREFLLSQLRASSLYEVEVLARSLGQHGQAAMFTFRTGKEPKMPPIDIDVTGNNDSHTVPEAPDRPTVATASDTSAYVTWIPRANGGSPITAFHVEYRRLGGGAGPGLPAGPGGGGGPPPPHAAAGEWTVAAKGIPPSKLSVEVKGLQPGATYRFRVAASNVCGESARSLASRAYAVGGSSERPSPRPVAGPYITYTEALGSSQILLKWTYTPEANNNTPIRGFYIFYRPTDSDNDADYTQDVADSETRHHTIRSLLPETSYDIKMRVFNDGGQSEFSNVMISETKARKLNRAPSPVPPLNTSNGPSANSPHPPDGSEHRDKGGRDSGGAVGRGGKSGGGDDAGGSAVGGGALLYLLLGLLLGLMVLTVLGFVALRGWKARGGGGGGHAHGNGVGGAGCVDETQLTELSGYECRHVYDRAPCNGLYPHAYGDDPHVDIGFTELPQEECRTDGRPTGRPPHGLANGVGGQGSHETSPLNSRRANDEEEEEVVPTTEVARVPSRSSADPTIDSLGDTDTEPGDGLPAADSDGERRGGVSCDSGLATQASSSPSPGHRPPALLQEETEQQQPQQPQ